ncbi:protein translocase SEC61 complex subunit gamma [Candidatus Woesearchaeota archaeon]|nr:protein translocase SEC61 complex subunit gamma [Candidatus Woesearchaeota archaeon]
MIKKLLIKFKTFIIESRRVFQITKKPSKQEFQTIVKVTAIGAAIIGLIGFIIQIGFILIK